LTLAPAQGSGLYPRFDKRRCEGPRWLRYIAFVTEPQITRSPLILAGVAALMGAAGVGLAAAGAHASGGELASRGALFLLLHAAAALAIAAHARVATHSARALVIVGFVMEAGAALFSAELAMRAFTGERIVPFAAPIGGSTMMISWLALAIVFAAAGRGQK
jgi:uncharacterized membrane protein YgdD (TMEM256/DUF423 family)